MKTSHKIIYIDSRKMDKLPNESIDLIVTSPPYPMIEMWDEVFTGLNKEIGNALKSRNGPLAFELMNKELDKVWDEAYRVLKNGGIACINIGDATRTINSQFCALYEPLANPAICAENWILGPAGHSLEKADQCAKQVYGVWDDASRCLCDP